MPQLQETSNYQSFALGLCSACISVEELVASVFFQPSSSGGEGNNFGHRVDAQILEKLALLYQVEGRGGTGKGDAQQYWNNETLFAAIDAEMNHHQDPQATNGDTHASTPVEMNHHQDGDTHASAPVSFQQQYLQWRERLQQRASEHRKTPLVTDGFGDPTSQCLSAIELVAARRDHFETLIQWGATSVSFSSQAPVPGSSGTSMHTAPFVSAIPVCVPCSLQTVSPPGRVCARVCVCVCVIEAAPLYFRK
jgi:hypothetical protein